MVQLTLPMVKDMCKWINRCTSCTTFNEVSPKKEQCREYESVEEAVGDFVEPIYDLIDELGDSSIVLDNPNPL